jgi:hypothetical protein
MRKPTRKSLLNKLYDLWRTYIYMRDNFTCQKCGRKKGQVKINAHHCVTKGSSGFAGKYDVDNGMVLCYHCHRHDSGKYYVEFGDFVKAWLKNKGLDYYELRDKYSECAGGKPTLEDIENKIKVIEEMTKELESHRR